MTLQQKVKFIREKCIEANEEIVELKQGCFIKDFLKGTLEILARYEIKGETPVYDFVFRGEYEVSVMRSPQKMGWEIIGRPLNLPDILLAITKTGEIVRYMAVVADNGESILLSTKKHEGIAWNLKKTFDEQEDALKEFIYDILK